jgi:hypothetical protein
MTDYQIAAKTCELLGLDPSEPLVERLVRRYEALLPTSLPRRVGHVLPNVREILEQLRGRSDVRSYLLTGNTRGGARAKLTHYDVIQFFPDGAFAEDTGDRASIAQRAMVLARRSDPAGRRVRDRRHAARHRVRQRHRRALAVDGRLLGRGVARAPALAALRRAAGS